MTLAAAEEGNLGTETFRKRVTVNKLQNSLRKKKKKKNSIRFLTQVLKAPYRKGMLIWFCPVETKMKYKKERNYFLCFEKKL